MRVGTHGMMQVDYEQRMDFDRMREYRVARIMKYMDEFDIECLLLFESGNKRYATSTAVASPEVDNMGRYAIVPRNGYPHIFGEAVLPVDQGHHLPGPRHHARRAAHGMEVL